MARPGRASIAAVTLPLARRRTTAPAKDPFMPPTPILSGPRPKHLPSLQALVQGLSPGERVFLPGSTGEPPGLTDALFNAGAVPLDITASYVPGVNAVPVARFTSGTTYTSMFAQPTIAEAQATGVVRHLPLSYNTFARHMQANLAFDATIVHVAPPDANGMCSLGLAVEFTAIAVRKSKRILAVINPRNPKIPNSPALPLSSFDAVTEIDAPLRTYDVGQPSGQADAIAGLLAHFVEDGVTLQIGIGKVPDALMSRLTDRRGLKLFSGMLSDGARSLVESGSLDRSFQHTCCLHLGTAGYYDWVRDRREFLVRGCDYTHAATVLAGLPRLVSVNSALSVDLFGQANLEMLGGRMVSGCGGAPDFARGAQLSDGGVSIIALPSTAGREAATRIVARLDAIATLPRTDVDVVVTEHGFADLRGRSVMERAERIIAIAAPQHRSTLADAWRDMARRI